MRKGDGPPLIVSGERLADITAQNVERLNSADAAHTELDTTSGETDTTPAEIRQWGRWRFGNGDSCRSSCCESEARCYSGLKAGVDVRAGESNQISQPLYNRIAKIR
jgi:hypothetical protein